jgi:hypothetical protein
LVPKTHRFRSRQLNVARPQGGDECRGIGFTFSTKTNEFMRGRMSKAATTSPWSSPLPNAFLGSPLKSGLATGALLNCQEAREMRLGLLDQKHLACTLGAVGSERARGASAISRCCGRLQPAVTVIAPELTAA